MRTLHIGRGVPRFRLGRNDTWQWGVQKVGSALWFELGPIFFDIVWQRP